MITLCKLTDRLFCTLFFVANSQVVQLLVKRLDLHAVLLDFSLLNCAIPRNLLVTSMEAFLRDTYGDIEIGDLMGVLAGCRDFDGAGPVEVEVAERVGQLLKLVLSKR